MKIHKIKVWEQVADDIYDGRKSFELRKNDRFYQTGDILEFHVIDPEMPQFTLNHPLEGKHYLITYMLSGWGLKEDYVAMAIRPYVEEGNYNGINDVGLQCNGDGCNNET